MWSNERQPWLLPLGLVHFMPSAESSSRLSLYFPIKSSVLWSSKTNSVVLLWSLTGASAWTSQLIAGKNRNLQMLWREEGQMWLTSVGRKRFMWSFEYFTAFFFCQLCNTHWQSEENGGMDWMKCSPIQIFHYLSSYICRDVLFIYFIVLQLDLIVLHRLCAEYWCFVFLLLLLKKQ